MQIDFHNVNKEGIIGATLVDGKIIFSAVRPIVIQSSEIMKVQTDLVIRVEKGFVLNISTHPDLAQKGAELFPGLITVDSSANSKPLEFPVKNNGRSALNLMRQGIIAVGYSSKVQKIEIGEFQPELEPSSKDSRSTPQRKNPNIKFEVR